jgi:hypothetical protein
LCISSSSSSFLLVIFAILGERGKEREIGDDEGGLAFCFSGKVGFFCFIRLGQILVIRNWTFF